MSNFTDVQVAGMVEGYNPKGTQAERDAQVKQLAKEYKTGEPNVRGVLVSREVYVAKVTKKAGGAVRKEGLVNFMRIMLGAPDGTLESFEKATKTDLEVAVQCLNALNDAYTTQD